MKIGFWSHPNKQFRITDNLWDWLVPKKCCFDKPCRCLVVQATWKLFFPCRSAVMQKIHIPKLRLLSLEYSTNVKSVDIVNSIIILHLYFDAVWFQCNIVLLLHNVDNSPFSLLYSSPIMTSCALSFILNLNWWALLQASIKTLSTNVPFFAILWT